MKNYYFIVDGGHEHLHLHGTYLPMYGNGNRNDLFFSSVRALETIFLKHDLNFVQKSISWIWRYLDFSEYKTHYNFQQFLCGTLSYICMALLSLQALNDAD